LSLRNGLHRGHPLSQPRAHSGVIGGDLRQHAKAEAAHGVETNPLVRARSGKELEHLRTGVIHIVPGNVTLIDEQNRSSGLGVWSFR
jgi:hypothetical protein